MLIYYIIGAVGVVVLLGLGTYKAVKKRRSRGNNVEEIKDVRYTTTTEFIKENAEGDVDAKISYNRNDILIPVNTEKAIGRDTDVKPGKYIILTTAEGTEELKVRLGGYVRIYAHGSEVILAEGDTITPVNVGIILR